MIRSDCWRNIAIILFDPQPGVLSAIACSQQLTSGLSVIQAQPPGTRSADQIQRGADPPVPAADWISKPRIHERTQVINLKRYT